MKKGLRNLLLVSAGILILAGYALWNHSRLPNPLPAPLESKDGNPVSAYRWPAEFERQQGVWLQWPSEVYEEKGESVKPAMINIIKALDPHVTVNIAARSNDEIDQIKGLLQDGGYAGTNARFYVFDHLSIWARDVGPVHVRDGQGNLNVVDFGFNNYSRDGSQAYIDTENQVHRLIAQYFGYPLVKTNLISEGGAIESNGRGTMISTEAVALKRNPGMTRQQIEDEYKRVLGVSKVIWLKNGLAEDDAITTGHINEYCRFSDANTILLAQVLPEDRYVNQYSQESYTRMETNYSLLQSSTDQDGNPFKIVRIPIPPTLYDEKDSSGAPPVRSYLNFLITNGAVITPTYWKPGRSDELKAAEEKVMEAFRAAFPGREIIGIDAESINSWGGGIHCCTQPVPADAPR